MQTKLSTSQLPTLLPSLIPLYLFPQPPRLLLHLLLPPRLPLLVLRPLLRLPPTTTLHLPLMPPHIPLLPFQPLMHLVPLPRIPLHPRNYMAMHMRHALPRRLPILNRDIERLGLIYPLQRPLHARNGEEEVADLIAGKVREVWFHGEGGDEDVAWEEGFEVYEREGVGGCVEDLPFLRCLAACLLVERGAGVDWW